MNLKKLLILLLSVITVASIGLFAACGKKEEDSSSSSSDGEVTLTKIEYLSGIPDMLVRGTEPDFTALKIKATYSDGKTEEIAYNADDFVVTVDTSVKGEAVPVTITYKRDKTATRNVKVDFQVAFVNQAEFVNIYNSKLEDSSAFIDKTGEYVVGAGNEFYYVPSVTVFDSDEEPYVFDKSGEFEIVAEVYKKVGESYTLLTAPESDVEINAANSSFKFAPAAIGNCYKLVVRPAELTEEQLADKDDYSIEFSFKVADAYNVYSAAELLLWDNRTDDRGNAVKALREAKGVTADSSKVNGLALHCDIKLGKDDIPADFIYSAKRDTSAFAGLSAEKAELLEGSLKDYENIITRSLGKDGKFDFQGNYFTISAENVPMVVWEHSDDAAFNKKPESVISHTTLLRIEADSRTNAAENSELGTINNVNFIGNLNRQDSVWSGGCILIKTNAAAVQMNNVVATRWYITAFSEKNTVNNHLVLNKCKFLDNYNCILYLWGGIVNINGCTLQGAGGPAIIADHVDRNSASSGRNGNGGWVSELYVDDDSVIESFVTGQEGWFEEMSASSAAAQIVALDGMFNPFNRTFVVGTKNVTVDGKDETYKTINLVCVFKDSAAAGMTFVKISGKAEFGTGSGKHVFDYDNPYTSPVLDSFKGKGAPIMQSSIGGIIAYAGASNGVPNIMEPLKSGSNVLDYMGLAAGSPDNYPQLFKDTGYLNLFYGAEGINNDGYLGIILGNYRAIK